MSTTHRELLDRHPADRVTRNAIRAFCTHLEKSCGTVSIASYIGGLYMIIGYMAPGRDWRWLKDIKARLEAVARPRVRPALPFTSAALQTLALNVMDKAEVEAEREATGRWGITLRTCRQYRDALMLAFGTLIPLRRRNLAQMLLGETLIQCGARWVLAIDGKDTKNGEPIEAVLPDWLGERINHFVIKFRPHFPASDMHNGLWASTKGRPMTGDAIYDALQDLVLRQTGKRITLHDLRRIAATTIALYDPRNATAGSDLLGHRKPEITYAFYNRASSIQATRVMADIVKNIRKMPPNN
jgi:integrase